MIDEVFQFLARLEESNFFRRHFHLGAGLGIAAGASAALARAEAAEAADFDFVAGLKSGDDAVENGVDDQPESLRGNSVTRVTSSMRSAFVTVRSFTCSPAVFAMEWQSSS